MLHIQHVKLLDTEQFFMANIALASHYVVIIPTKLSHLHGWAVLPYLAIFRHAISVSQFHTYTTEYCQIMHSTTVVLCAK